MLSGLIPAKRGLKNIMVNIAKIPVFNTGTISDAKIEDSKSCLLFNNLETIPATIPAIVVFNKQAKTVPTGLIVKNTDIVLGENKVKIPEINPSKPPTIGPYNIAPKAIKIKEKFKLANPPGITT